MRYEYFLAFRYLTGLRRSQPFITVIAAISVIGVGLGVAVLIGTLGIMTGFDDDIQSKMVGNNPHLLIRAEGDITDPDSLRRKVSGFAGVVATAPFMETKGFLQNGKNGDGVILRGIVPGEEREITGLVEALEEGIWPESGNRIVLGTELAYALGAQPGSEVEIFVGAKRKPVPMTVVGIFKTGMYDYDRHLAIAPVAAVQELLGQTDRVTGLGIRLTSPVVADKLKEQIQQALGYPYWVMSWMDLNPNLFAALRLEKIVMFIVLALIILVACFNIIATLLMMVIEKVKEIGILKALGAPPGSIQNIFTCAGLVIGLGGTALGTAMGVTFCWALDKYQFIQLPASVYYIDHLPVKLVLSDVAAVVGASILISWLACLYPAWMAARLSPATAIRYE